MSLRVLALAAVLSTAAAAQETAPEPGGIGGQNVPNAGALGSQAFTDPSQLFSGRAGAFFGLAFNRIPGEGNYVNTIINTEFNLGPVGLGLALPLNLLVYPEPGIVRDDIAYNGVLRKRDWDEPLDYFKLVRFIRYGHKRDPVYVLAGQMWGASIGHGTLVNRYANSLNLDHTKFGLALDVNTTFFGFETMTDSVGDPALIGGRAYVRPFGDTLFLRGWAVGATVVTDRTAPRHYVNAGGTTVPVLQQDDKGNPLVASDSVFAGGVDTEFELLHNSIISLIPYVDLNRIAGAGNGLHAGILTDIYLPVPILDINVQARLEYRMMQPGYIPEYFDQTYDLGRVQYIGTCPAEFTAACPKYVAAQHAHLNAADPGAIDRKGYYGELAFGFAGILQIGGLYQDYEGDPAGASLGLFVTFPKLEVIKLSAYYLRKNMKGFDDAFKLDERSLLAASAAYKIFGPLYLRVDFQRRWELPPGATEIKAVDNFQAGIATFIAF
ncbi:MAG: hypothetical protein E6J88_10065 [Deltaproteobacteria bacterium]|nr:MAG: hypothetical protein E6J88_10065 [Deltaproteobacteria bacterium]